MSSSIEELEQDIRSLRTEMESLTVKSANLKQRIEKLTPQSPSKPRKSKRKDKKKKQAVGDKNTITETVANSEEIQRNGVLNEFGPIFEKFPQLHDLLYKEYRFQDNEDQNNSEAFDDDSGYSSSLSSSSSSLDESNRAMTPQKRRRIVVSPASREEDNVSNDMDDDGNLPEYEWVLKNQPTIEHKMFDTSVGDMLDTTILSSPSKRKNRQQLNNDASKGGDHPDLDELKEDIMMENMFRLFGITFFPVIDPTDLQLNVDTQELDITREMLGIRFDIFNQVLRHFETPFYILLKRRLKSKSWAIFKHTIPGYIDVEVLFVDITINGTSTNGFEDIYLFAKEVYLQLWRNSIRSQIFDELVQDGRISLAYNDMRSTRVQFKIIETPIKLELQLKEDQVKSVRILGGVSDMNIQTNISMILLGSIHELKQKLSMIKASIEYNDNEENVE